MAFKTRDPLYARQTSERRTVAIALFALSVAVAVMSIVAAHRQSIWVMVGAIGAALYFLSVMNEGTVVYDETEDAPYVAPIGSRASTWPAFAYSAAGVVAIGSSMALWHKTSERTWNGFERGGGIPAALAGIILVVLAMLILAPPARHRRTANSPWPDAVAAACGTALVIASISSTGRGDMYLGRNLALLAGLVAAAAAITTLIGWKSDLVYKRGVSAGIIGLASTVIVAGSWMSWGEWRFMVNYVPGTSTGGFDGTFSMLAGLAILALSVRSILDWRFERGASTRTYLVAVLALGFVALVAAVGGAAPVGSHPGRALTIMASLVVMGWSATALGNGMTRTLTPPKTSVSA